MQTSSSTRTSAFSFAPNHCPLPCNCSHRPKRTEISLVIKQMRTSKFTREKEGIRLIHTNREGFRAIRTRRCCEDGARFRPRSGGHGRPDDRCGDHGRHRRLQREPEQRGGGAGGGVRLSTS
ncbi:hypothetical protein BHM03_00044351 [Ensete ventricosum]|nr:hypothetical protein BHM03_00044351 [Ensete ventricosum]